MKYHSKNYSKKLKKVVTYHSLDWCWTLFLSSLDVSVSAPCWWTPWPVTSICWASCPSESGRSGSGAAWRTPCPLLPISWPTKTSQVSWSQCSQSPLLRCWIVGDQRDGSRSCLHHPPQTGIRNVARCSQLDPSLSDPLRLQFECPGTWEHCTLMQKRGPCGIFQKQENIFFLNFPCFYPFFHNPFQIKLDSDVVPSC